MNVLQKEPGKIILSEKFTYALTIGAIFWILTIGALFGDISPKQGQEFLFYILFLSFPLLAVWLSFRTYRQVTLTVDCRTHTITKETQRLLQKPTYEHMEFFPQSVEVLTSRLRSDTGKTEQRITDICLINEEGYRYQLNTQSLSLARAHALAEDIGVSLHIPKYDGDTTELRDLFVGAKDAFSTLTRGAPSTLFKGYSQKK
jgi:hypothetical protein